MRRTAAVAAALLIVLSACGAGSGDGLDDLRPLATVASTATAQTGTGTEALPAPTSDDAAFPTFTADAPSFPTAPSLETSVAPGSLPVAGGYGIQIHGCGYPVGPALDLVVDAGFGWVKQQVRWEEMEPEFGEPDWKCLDEIVAGAEDRGLKVLLSVTTSPDWTRFGSEGEGAPDVLPLFGQFCLRIADRYKGRIHAIEVFNEPNLDIEWGDHLDPRAYQVLLQWAYSGIKQVDPGITVISAGLAPTEWNDWATAIGDREYLEIVTGASDKLHADCIGMHFNHGVSSPLEPGGPFEQQVMDYYNTFGGQRPVCITEFGIATPDRTGGKLAEGFEWAADTTAAEQAEWLVDGLEWAEAHEDIVPLVIVWNLNYHDDNPENNNVLYALWGPKGMMPAYDAIKVWLQER